MICGMMQVAMNGNMPCVCVVEKDCAHAMHICRHGETWPNHND